MPSQNDVTGDRLVSGVPSQLYKEQWELIFGKDKEASKNIVSDVDNVLGAADVSSEVGC